MAFVKAMVTLFISFEESLFMPYPLFLSLLPPPPPPPQPPFNMLVLALEKLSYGGFVPNLLTNATRRLITYHKTFTLKGYYNNVYEYMYVS